MLAPLVLREIHYRLLTSDQAGRLRQLASVGSQSHLVARAIDWLKANFASPLRIEELAGRVHMSASSLHHHFRQLTAMSPLQYQKWLRLNQARRLMLNEGFDAARAAFDVGYERPIAIQPRVRPTLRRATQTRRGHLAEQGRDRPALAWRSPRVTP